MSIRSSLPFRRNRSGYDQAVGSVLSQFDMAISQKSKAPDETSEDTGTQSLIEECKRSPAKFREHLLRDNGFEKVRIGTTLDEWQKQDFEAIDPAWLYAARVSRTKPAKQRAYLERPRGHSKTSDTALMVCWAVMAAPMMITGYAAAASEDQAKFIILAARKLVSDNPWLGELLKIQEGKILNIDTGSSCEVVAAKANTKFGQTPDFIVCDELTHWVDKKVWSALFSGLMKVETCVMVVITNAGENKGNCWQWNVRERMRQHHSWYFSSLDGVQASWMTQEKVDEQSDGLDDNEHKRLVLNMWVSGKTDGIPFHQIVDCTTLIQENMAPNHNCTFVIGSLDIGIKHDRTSLVWLGISLERKRIELLGHQTWRPKESKNGEVQIAEVEEAIIQGVKMLGGVDTIYADNWQAVRSLQSLDNQGIRCREINYGSSIVAKRLAKDFVLAFKNGMIALYFDKVLENDLLSIEVKYNDHSRTYKLHADRDENGHADSGFALAQGIMMAQIWLEENEQSDEEIDTGFETVCLD